MSLKQKMFMRLSWPPALFLSGGLVLLLILGVFIPKQFEGQQIFSQISAASIRLAPWSAIAGIVLAALSVAVQSWRWYQWSQGNAPCCHNCGGMVADKFGRYGTYTKCLACGANWKA